MSKVSTHRSKAFKTAPTWAVQCRSCENWRVIQTQEEYEEIREKIKEKPFSCNRKEGVSCNDPPVLEQATRGCLWALDKPSLPKSPSGFKRKITIRKGLNRLEVYYETPTGMNLRRMNQVSLFLSKHPEYNHIPPEQFQFKPPTIAKKKHKLSPRAS